MKDPRKSPKDPRTGIDYYRLGIEQELAAASAQGASTSGARLARQNFILGGGNVGILLATIGGKIVKYERLGGSIQGIRDGKRYADEGVWIRDANNNRNQVGRCELELPDSSFKAWLQYNLLDRNALRPKVNKPERLNFWNRLKVRLIHRADQQKAKRGPQ